MSARRVDSDWAITTEDSFTRDAEGNRLVLAMAREGYRGRALRVQNVYFQKKGRDGVYRPAERAMWGDILGDGDCILAGDFNAHSPVWNSHRRTRRNAAFLEGLVETNELQGLNDGTVTRPANRDNDIHSDIDLTLATPGAGPMLEE